MKPSISMLPVGPIIKAANVMTLAASKKHKKDDWRRGYKWTVYIDKILRHALAFLDGEDLDPDLGTCHIDNLICDAMILSEYRTTHPEMDDRVKKNNDKNRIYEDRPGKVFTDVGGGTTPTLFFDPNPPPRYDEVFLKGRDWLDSLGYVECAEKDGEFKKVISQKSKRCVACWGDGTVPRGGQNLGYKICKTCCGRGKVLAI